ncbi:MAG: nucleotidyltransferase domain-containing protein [Planctomycetota bacterium]
MNVVDIEKRLREFFRRQSRDVVAAYLFGSVARGDAHPQSDVDVGVLFEKSPPPTLEGLSLRLEGELEAYLGCPVQVVDLNGAPVDLTHRVLRDGKLLHDADPALRIRFEVRVRNEFFDVEPYLKEYRRITKVAP